MRHPADRSSAAARAPWLAAAVFMAAVLPVLAQSSDPWRAAPFSLSPAALLAAAEAETSSEEAPALVLLSEATISFDAAGSQTTRVHVIVRLLQASAVEDWSGIAVDWSPWHQARPAIRVRVVTRDGAEHPLDPKTVAEEGASEGSADLYGDRRRLRAPLPAVAVGSVLEEEIIERESSPLLDAGEVGAFEFGGGEPVQHTRLVITAPASLPLNVRSHGRAPAPRREETPEGVRLTYEAGRLEPAPDFEMGVPSDTPQGSFVAFATGASWQTIAARYSQIVDGQIAGADLKAALREAEGAAGDRAQLPARLLAWVQKRVRYTGVEFSDASIVPRAPAETLKRKFGDCKDKAALLVALLRAAGQPASVAILKAGPGPDVDPELPGFGRFDHAIVYVSGTPGLWIDPTDEYARAGELPTPDQDRLALIARPDSTTLTRTPASGAADNRTAVTREFILPERGLARVNETTIVSGGPERSLRRSYGESDRKHAQENAEAYARQEYLARGAVHLTFTDVADLGKPFEVKLEIEDAARGGTDESGCVAAIRLDSLLTHLPVALRAESAEERTEGPPAATARRRRKRAQDFVFFEPFTVEWRYRLVPPPGYKPAPLPASRVETLGTVSLAMEFAAERDATVSARLKLDSGKRRISPEQFEATREATLRLSRSDPILLRFESVGQAYLEAGRVREALTEFRRLAELHPAEGLHHSQTALALLAGGLGDAARAEARRATEVEPKSSYAWRIYGWTLQHDLLGRRFGKGFDLPAAVAAYRKARALDTDDLATRADLAILLEHDADGERYSPRADLAGAIAEYQAIRADLKSKAFDTNLCIALYRAGRFTELAETARQTDASPTRDQFLILAAAATGGTDAGIREGARLIADPAQRRQAYETVGRTLAQLRLYKEAAALLDESAVGAPSAAQVRSLADVLKKTRRHEELSFPENDPQSVVPRFLIALFTASSKESDHLRSFFPRAVTAQLALEKDPHGDPAEQISRLATDTVRRSGAPRDMILDTGLAALRQNLDGDDATGYRARLAGAPGFGQNEEIFFLVREDGKWKILATGSALGFLGVEALDRADRDDLPGARRWLDWAREELPPPGGDDPFAGSPFSRLWTKGASSDKDRVRLAAAALAAGQAAADRVAPILEAARTSAAESDRDMIDLALARIALASRDWAKLYAPVSRLLSSKPDSEAAFELTQLALTRLSRSAEAKKAAEDRLKRSPGDRLALRALFQIAASERRYNDADRYGRELVGKGGAVAVDLNNLAWNALFAGTISDAAIEDARRAVDMTHESSSASLHTLAALYADVGKTTEARELLFKAIEARGTDEPDEDDWYVLGRIAENYGERAAAVAAYRRVTRPKAEAEIGQSTWLLAQKRLSGLGPEGAARKP
jgi:tetratricopeptide (TPR) repeat protein